MAPEFSTFLRTVVPYLKSDEPSTIGEDKGSGIALAFEDSAAGTASYNARMPIARVRFIAPFFHVWFSHWGSEALSHLLLERICVDRPRHTCKTCKRFSFVVHVFIF